MIDDSRQMLKVAFVGGDRRQWRAAQYFVQAGFSVMVDGLPPVKGTSGEVGDAAYIVLPVAGLDQDGWLKQYEGGSLQCGEQWLSRLPKGTMILAGKTPQEFAQWCQALSLSYHPYLADAAYQAANAVPTAEGVIRLLLEKRSQTVAGAEAVILGFGHCGKAVALRLMALGARVTVVARSSSDRAYGRMLGLVMLDYDQLPRVIADADIICNTVPALLLDRQVLPLIKQTGMIIDVASAPGGTDFDLARKLGLSAELEGNLPGRFFPETSGRILAEHLEKLIIEHHLASVATD